jgi:hypothetical protein
MNDATNGSYALSRFADALKLYEEILPLDKGKLALGSADPVV